MEGIGSGICMRLILKTWSNTDHSYRAHILLWANSSDNSKSAGWRVESGTWHALGRSCYLAVSETISLDHCSEGWSCWALCSSVQRDRLSLQRSRPIVSKLSNCTIYVKHKMRHPLFVKQTHGKQKSVRLLTQDGSVLAICSHVLRYIIAYVILSQQDSEFHQTTSTTSENIHQFRFVSGLPGWIFVCPMQRIALDT